MERQYLRRKDIADMTGLGKDAVARLVDRPDFPTGTWVNSRVVLYPRGAVQEYLASGRADCRPARTRSRRSPAAEMPLMFAEVAA